jgi:hypothetical protein
MAKSKDKVPATIDVEVDSLGPQPPAGWEEEVIGFPPYWEAAPGKAFQGIVLGEDLRDPDFPRFLIRATAELDCASGPKEAQEHIRVMKGGLFNVGQYASLAPTLRDYAGLEVYVVATGKRDLDNVKTLWTFRMLTSPENKKFVDRRRLSAQNNLPKELQDHPASA